MIYGSPKLSRLDLRFVQAFQGLLYQAGKAGRSALWQEAINFQKSVLQQCGIPEAGSVSGSPDCLAAAYERQRALWLSRLEGAAREEATRPIREHVALQAKLQQLGFLPATAKIDGVYGPATRAAILAWQGANGRPETDFLGNADASALEGAAPLVVSRAGAPPPAPAIPALVNSPSAPSPAPAPEGGAPAFDCSNITLSSTAVICSDPELRRLGAERQEAFNEAMARLDPTQQKALLADQTGWVHSYATACGVRPNRPAPDPVPAAVKECFEQAGRARIAYLRAYGAPPAATPTTAKPPAAPSVASGAPSPPSPAPPPTQAPGARVDECGVTNPSVYDTTPIGKMTPCMIKHEAHLLREEYFSQPPSAAEIEAEKKLDKLAADYCAGALSQFAPATWSKFLASIHTFFSSTMKGEARETFRSELKEIFSSWLGPEKARLLSRLGADAPDAARYGGTWSLCARAIYLVYEAGTEGDDNDKMLIEITRSSELDRRAYRLHGLPASPAPPAATSSGSPVRPTASPDAPLCEKLGINPYGTACGIAFASRAKACLALVGKLALATTLAHGLPNGLSWREIEIDLANADVPAAVAACAIKRAKTGWAHYAYGRNNGRDYQQCLRGQDLPCDATDSLTIPLAPGSE